MADDIDVITFGRVSDHELDVVLESLPEDYATASLGDARFVMGPSGAFVVAPAGDDLATVAGRLADLAAATRATLADHLTWAPFVDALVVVGAEEHSPAGATAVPLDLLADVLVEGPTTLDQPTLDRIAAVVAAGRAAGGEADGEEDPRE